MGSIRNKKILACIMTYMFKADILLLADVFEHFRDMYIEIHELDPAHFFLHRD